MTLPDDPESPQAGGARAAQSDYRTQGSYVLHYDGYPTRGPDFHVTGLLTVRWDYPVSSDVIQSLANGVPYEVVVQPPMLIWTADPAYFGAVGGFDDLLMRLETVCEALVVPIGAVYTALKFFANDVGYGEDFFGFDFVPPGASMEWAFDTMGDSVVALDKRLAEDQC